MKTQRDYWSRLFLAGGNLNNRDAAGSAYLNLNNGPGNANWNIGGRECEIFPARCRGGNNPPAVHWAAAML